MKTNETENEATQVVYKHKQLGEIKVGDKVVFRTQLEDGGSVSKLTRVVRDIDRYTSDGETEYGIYVKIPFWGLSNLMDIAYTDSHNPSGILMVVK